MSNLDSSTRDAILETSRKSMHRHIVRRYDTYVSCEKCKSPSIVSDRTVGYVCRNCSKYNSVETAKQRYEAGDFIQQESKFTSLPAPFIKSSETREYMNFRDEHEIRADLFSQGKTRDSMGVGKFNNHLRKELVKNKCYRGSEKTGV